jgi:hypothetical protein
MGSSSRVDSRQQNTVLLQDFPNLIFIATTTTTTTAKRLIVSVINFLQ